MSSAKAGGKSGSVGEGRLALFAVRRPELRAFLELPAFLELEDLGDEVSSPGFWRDLVQ